MIQQSCTRQCYFGTMHITLRMAIMLSIVGAFKRRWWLSNRGFCWQGWKPVVGNKDKACTRALGFKNRGNNFLNMHVSSTNASRQLNHFLRWTSFEERLPNEDDHIPLISFVYHCQSFLISHEQSVKEGLFVILILSRAHSLPVPSRIMGLHIRHAIPGWSLPT